VFHLECFIFTDRLLEYTDSSINVWKFEENGHNIPRKTEQSYSPQGQ
jgi:hypothetical protein